MSSVPFAKPPLDFASQLKRLSDRCLDSDKSELGELMLTTSYYRLKSYLQPFLGWAQASFSVADLKRLMQFDHDLRVLILDCLEKVEIYFRSAINEHMNAVTCDAFWYLNSDHFMNVSVHKALLKTVKEETERSRDSFIKEYTKTYTLPVTSLSTHHDSSFLHSPPSWMVIEICSFGFFSKLFKLLKPPYRKGIAPAFQLDEKLVASWFHSFSVTRNICAHHARLWNKVLGVRPIVPKHDKFFDLSNHSNKVSMILLMLIRQLEIIDGKDSEQAEKIRTFIVNSSRFQQDGMGFAHEKMNRLV